MEENTPTKCDVSTQIQQVRRRLVIHLQHLDDERRWPRII